MWLGVDDNSSLWRDAFERLLERTTTTQKSTEKELFLRHIVTELIDIYITAAEGIWTSVHWQEACSVEKAPFLRAYILGRDPPFEKLPKKLR